MLAVKRLSLIVILSLYLLGPVFGQRPICSIISCLIIGAIFPSQDRALFVLPNIAQPTTSSSLSSKETDATTSIAIIIATILFLLQILTLAIFPLLKPKYQDFIKHSNTFVGWDWSGWQAQHQSHIVLQLTVSPSDPRTIDNWTTTQCKGRQAIPKKKVNRTSNSIIYNS